MAGQEEVMVSLPRKRIATYGKAVRRRIPEQSFTRFRQSQSPEKKSVPTPSRSPSVMPLEAMRLKSPKKRPSPSAVPVRKANVFDVPSSDDESATPIAPKPRKPAPKAMVKNKVQKATGSKVALPVEEVGRRKRIRLSPAVMEVEKTILPPSKVMPNSIELGETKVMASRPKASSVIHRKPEQLRIPLKLSISSKDGISNTPTLLENGTDVMDIDTPNTHISPRGQQIWKEVMNTVSSDGPGGPASITTVSTNPQQKCHDFSPESAQKLTRKITSPRVPVSCFIRQPVSPNTRKEVLGNFLVEDSSIH